MKIPRKLLLAVMGVGVVSLLGSAGTLAVFTATMDNPGNQFTSGTLTLSDTTTVTSVASTLGASAPNQTGTNPRSGSDCATALVAQVCSSLVRSVNVATNGIEPGQYLQVDVLLANGGTTTAPQALPASIALQIQNVKTNNGNSSLYSGAGAAGTSPCSTDIGGAGSPGNTGKQLTSGATTSGYLGAAVPITGCLDLGRALRITVQDMGDGGTGPQCLFGNDTGGTVGSGSTNGNDRLQAPAVGGLGTGTGVTAFVATGSKLGTGSGACDNLSQANTLGRTNAPVLPSSNPKDAFGLQGATTGNGSFSALSGLNNFIFVPGNSTALSVVNSPTFGGDLRHLPQWRLNEAHTFRVTLAFPNTGSTVLTDRNQNRYQVGNDNSYQGGAVSFDLYWFAIQ